MAQEVVINEDAVRDFWNEVLAHDNRYGLNFYLGVESDSVLQPPTFAFCEDDREQATKLAALVLAEVKTATSSLRAQYEQYDEPLPEKGTLNILVKGDGTPVALLETLNVQTLRFDQVDATIAQAEGENDGSLHAWRQIHEQYFSAIAPELWRGDGSDLIVIEHFHVCYPR